MKQDQIPKAFERQVQEFRERLADKLKSNSSYQQRTSMTADERRREAVEIVAKNRHERNKLSGDAVPSYEKSLSESQRMAEKNFRNK